MSISVGHRAIATAFGWGHASAQRTAAAPPATEKPASIFPAPSAVPAAVESGALVCSPWEGLYLEQAHPVTAHGKEARGNAATASQQLDSFLNSLLYGE